MICRTGYRIQIPRSASTNSTFSIHHTLDSPHLHPPCIGRVPLRFLDPSLMRTGSRFVLSQSVLLHAFQISNMLLPFAPQPETASSARTVSVSDISNSRESPVYKSFLTNLPGLDFFPVVYKHTSPNMTRPGETPQQCQMLCDCMHRYPKPTVSSRIARKRVGRLTILCSTPLGCRPRPCTRS